MNIICNELTDSEVPVGARLKLKRNLVLPKETEALVFGSKDKKCALMVRETKNYDRFVESHTDGYAVVAHVSFEYRSGVNVDEMLDYEGQRSLTSIHLRDTATFLRILCTPEVNTKEKFQKVMSDVLDLMIGYRVNF